jgi:hypothetical protein
MVMTVLSDFDDEGRELLLRTPGAVLKGTVVSDGSTNALVFLREVTAGARVFREAQDHENGFVKSVALALRERRNEPDDDRELPITEKSVPEALKLAGEAGVLLRERADREDAQAYAAWLLHLADEVARAVKTREGGLFSKKVAVSEGERTFIEALGLALRA